MTIEVTTDKLNQILEKAARRGGNCSILLTTTDDEEVWLDIETPAARKPRQRRAANSHAEPEIPEAATQDGPVEAAMRRLNAAADK
jgi:hypothetical protein